MWWNVSVWLIYAETEGCWWRVELCLCVLTEVHGLGVSAHSLTECSRCVGICIYLKTFCWSLIHHCLISSSYTHMNCHRLDAVSAASSSHRWHSGRSSRLSASITSGSSPITDTLLQLLRDSTFPEGRTSRCVPGFVTVQRSGAAFSTSSCIARQHPLNPELCRGSAACTCLLTWQPVHPHLPANLSLLHCLPLLLAATLRLNSYSLHHCSANNAGKQGEEALGLFFTWF